MAEEQSTQTQTRKEIAPNILYVSNRRPVMGYVLACVTIFNKGYKDARIIARGKAIVRAVDTAEVVRRKFVTDVVPSIRIGTDIYPNLDENGKEDGTTVALSTIEITLTKKGN
jgi:DNA-binding protein